MIRFFATWYAKLSYVASLEVEAGKSLLNSKLAAANANTKRQVVEQLKAEADAIDKSIADEQAKLEAGYWECENGHESDTSNCSVVGCKSVAKPIKLSEMTGQEKYELEREKKEAEAIAEEKRKLAKQEAENVSGGEQAAQHFRQNATNSRMIADKIRNL